MKYYSTHRQSPEVSFKTAVLTGLAPDKGLYFPEMIPVMEKSFFEKLPALSLPEIGYHFLKPYVEGDLSDDVLRESMEAVFSFDTPLAEVAENQYALELFHGPTLAFKDVGARTLARFMALFSGKDKTTILVATSGDTGSAVAQGFLGIPHVDVVVLYPKNKVSRLQEKQFTTLGQNITALEVDGTFDDCQRMVKTAFAHDELNRKMRLSSANSINIARLLPQAIYYFYGYGKVARQNKPVVISVPTGNLGNLNAGLLAKRAGLPVKQFIAAGNRNNVFQQYLETGVLKTRASVPTISNAMDVGNPSNFVRIQELYGHSYEDVCQDIVPFHFTDDETRQAMATVYRKTNYMLDPHGAVAWLGLSEYMKQHPGYCGIFLETAHPAKFYTVVEKEIGVKVPLPERLSARLNHKKKSIPVKNDPQELIDFLMEYKK